MPDQTTRWRLRCVSSQTWRTRGLSFITILFAFLATVTVVLLHWGHQRRAFAENGSIATHSFPYIPPILRSQLVSCRGARGLDLENSADDQVVGVVLDGDVPKPLTGSYEELGLRQTWSTADERYGPYGRDENSADYKRQKVDWEQVDWAALQNECLLRNLRPDINSTAVPLLSASRKMKSPAWTDQDHLSSTRLPHRAKTTTGRTAIVLRGWTDFHFKDEDLWNVRALITETALHSGGRYSVILLVDVKGDLDVMSNAKQYEQVLASVPAEFRGMTVLFDQQHFLKAWYPRVLEYDIGFQIEQARQVFAHSFDEFDHYWQIEMDARFTGHTGTFLDAIDAFARNEPRKQARERASFSYIPEIYGTYANFKSSVDEALHGGSAFWNGLQIPDIEPIGPEPPVRNAEDDHFSWGVGEEADLVLLNPMSNNTLSKDWMFHKWISGFKHPEVAERVLSAPAMSRCSWNLLNEIHQAQVWQGLRVPSEATAASFALWHNMKISRPPAPKYVQNSDRHSAHNASVFVNGGLPSAEHDGMSWGQLSYGKSVAQGVDVGEYSPTYGWSAKYARRLTNVWFANDVEAVEGPEADCRTLAVREGQVLVPNMMLHPVKS